MGIEAKTRSIDGKRYTVTSFPARKGLRLKATLVKALGPALAELMKGTGGGSVAKKSLEVDVKMEHAARALAVAFGGVTEEEYESLVMRLIEDTMRDNQPITPETFDVDFAGDYMHLFKVLWFVLEVNYGSFFGKSGLGSIIALDRVSQPDTKGS